MTLEEAESAVHKAINDLLNVITEDHEISDEELQTVVQLEQDIADKISDMLAAHGVEFGDERVD